MLKVWSSEQSPLKIAEHCFWGASFIRFTDTLKWWVVWNMWGCWRWPVLEFCQHNSSSPIWCSVFNVVSYYSLLTRMFTTFFSDKLHKLYISNFFLISLHHFSSLSYNHESLWHCYSSKEIYELISDSSETFCNLDPILTSLKKCALVLVPTINKIINFSLSTGTCPDHFKSSLVLPHLKIANFDKEGLMVTTDLWFVFSF